MRPTAQISGENSDPLLDQESYKLARIESILAALTWIPFTLMGDDGERSPEIHRAIAKKHPARVAAIYIRKIHPDPARAKYPRQRDLAEAMPRMVAELMRQPEMGFLHAESWFGRTTMMVRYWKSLDHLPAYAINKEAEHLPVWRDFNRAVGVDGSVGIWHKTCLVSAGRYENDYNNMPAFGLGRAGSLQPATGKRESAADRVHAGP